MNDYGVSVIIITDARLLFATRSSMLIWSVRATSMDDKLAHGRDVNIEGSAS